jgi:alkanesulfonate monooxygenase SsuD/methylene tetrahydromethanopterin reductase-like flavin-dependent oxidoreductase (luciferase family)
MKFGTFHLFQKPPGWTDEDVFQAEFAQIHAAEDMGFDAVWMAEHHFQWYGIATDLMVLASSVAARTQRVRIGTAIVVLPFHNPIRLAEQVATVDLISRGRLDLGIGRGYQAAEFNGFGIPMDESKSRFAECVDFLIKAWTEDTFSFDGRYTRVQDLTIVPKPVQKPHPPVYVASWMTPETIRYAAERGFPIMAPAGLAADQVRTNFQLYRESLEALGRPTANLELPALVHVYVDENEDRARQVGTEYSARYGASLATLGSPAQDSGKLTADFQHYGPLADAGQALRESRNGMVLFGTPDTVARKIDWMQREMGVNYVMCWMNMGGLEPERVQKSMRLFAEEVMPRFRQVRATA